MKETSGDTTILGAGILGAERAALLAAARRLTELAETDPTGMSREELADAVGGLVATSEHAALLAGRYMDVGDTNAVCLTKGERTMTALVNTRSRIDKRRCTQLLRAGALKHRYSHFHTAMLNGRITTGHTDAFVGLAKRADSSQVAAAEKDLCALAVLCTPEEFRGHLATWEAAADPDEHLDEFIRAQARRNLSWGFDLFGNVHIGGTMEPVAGEQVVNAILNRRKQLEATSDAKGVAANHDALVDLILGDSANNAHIEIITTNNPQNGASNTGKRFRAVEDEDPFPIPECLNPDEVPEADARDLDLEQDKTKRQHQLDTHIDWLNQLDRHDRRRFEPPPPAPTHRDIGFNNILYPRTARGTLIPPAIVDQLAETGRVRYHPINPDGTFKNDTAASRRFTTVQKRMIRLRDNHCQHPGCRTPARYCDNDHIKDWEQGGRTLTTNAQLLCRFHHRWKHRFNLTHPTRIFDNTPLRNPDRGTTIQIE